MSLKELAHRIAACFASAIRIECRGLANESMRHSKMLQDVRLACETLGLSLEVDLDTAIRRTIPWNQKMSSVARAVLDKT